VYLYIYKYVHIYICIYIYRNTSVSIDIHISICVYYKIYTYLRISHFVVDKHAVGAPPSRFQGAIRHSDDEMPPLCSASDGDDSDDGMYISKSVWIYMDLDVYIYVYAYIYIYIYM
jgi:hypothetical protein